MMSRFFFLLVGAILAASVLAQTTTCDINNPCKVGCCGNGGLANNPSICGTGPTFCGAGNCTTNCDYKAECDPGGWGPAYAAATDCPLNVCCSPFGFCGTTEEFCGGATVPEPHCNGNSIAGRVIGYYEGWSLEKSCGTMTPDQIPLGVYTHLNFAFVSVDPTTFRISDMDTFTGTLYQQITGLKVKNPGLEVWVSVGGWSFNDPGPTASVFSTLASNTAAQQQFFASLISFMAANEFDGVDLDWEYPVAPERAGTPEDFANYPVFLRNLRAAMNASGYKFGLSITLPSSYWYLRNFDIVAIDPIVDFLNLMTYDLHGTWDGTDPFIGAVALAHTNLTEIQQSLDLMWRNNINPAKVNLGIGFYGRSFTMSNPNCLEAGCPFSGGGAPGPCTQSSGILSAAEIRDIVASGVANVQLDPVAGVEIITWDSNQWVSYDDEVTLKLKVDFGNSFCLGGMLIWAVDLDDLSGTSINALADAMGKPRSNVIDLTGLDFRPTSDLGDAQSGDPTGPSKRSQPNGRYLRGSA
ncbi:glycoside hydrolase superfamily [Bombardia bombarda]|uniref:chitinase n=1 Tax=Bombardia bombarda TaxID=252184 RepID=A0AA40C4Y4_9PEZI|nr:glycoside hydrolase superfamily [Bombardia bombarda]